MPSTFSNLGLTIQATGENPGEWGLLTNVNLQRIDNAIAGVIAVALTGNTTLAFSTNSASTTFSDEAGRNQVILFTGSLAGSTATVTLPNIEKQYYIQNNAGASVILTAGSGAVTYTVQSGKDAIVFVDGSDEVANAIDNLQLSSLDILTQGELRLQDTAGGQFIGLKSAGTVATSFTLTLPSADGSSGQAITTNGAGVLSFSSAGISTGKAIAMAMVFG